MRPLGCGRCLRRGRSPSSSGCSMTYPERGHRCASSVCGVLGGRLRWVGVTVVLAVLALVCSVASASAAVRYVAPAGTANGSCVQASPCDIVTAVNGRTGNMPTAGDEVVVEPGSYYELGTASIELIHRVVNGSDVIQQASGSSVKPVLVCRVA
jgi:hypothetical protein